MTEDEIRARIRVLDQMLQRLQSTPATKAGFLMLHNRNRAFCPIVLPATNTPKERGDDE